MADNKRTLARHNENALLHQYLIVFLSVLYCLQNVIVVYYTMVCKRVNTTKIDVILLNSRNLNCSFRVFLSQLNVLEMELFDLPCELLDFGVRKKIVIFP